MKTCKYGIFLKVLYYQLMHKRIVFKGVLKFALKLQKPQHVSVWSPSSGSVLCELAEVTMLKQLVKIHLSVGMVYVCCTVPNSAADINQQVPDNICSHTARLTAMMCVCVCIYIYIYIIVFIYIYIYINLKWSRYRPGVAQRVGRGIALLFHDGGTRRGWVVSSTPWPHFTRYPFYRGLRGPQDRCGRAENLVPTGIRSRSVQPVVSLYTNWATRSTCIYIYIYIYQTLAALLGHVSNTTTSISPWRLISSPRLTSRESRGRWLVEGCGECCIGCFFFISGTYNHMTEVGGS